MTATITERVAAVDARARTWCIGGARIVVGLMWLANLHWKVPPDFGEEGGGGLYKYSASVSRHSPFAPFTWVTEEIILPNFRFFGWFTLVVEMVIAMLLIIGYRTKLVALLGAAFTVPIMLSVIYYDRADEWSWSYLLMIAAHLLVYASDAGRHLGLDGLLAAGAHRQRRALTIVGAVLAALGVLGLWVARSVDFAGRRAALLGSDAGFTNDDGAIVRRWELKFLWFNPLWAILTVAAAVLVILGARHVWAAWAGAVGLAVMAVAVFATRTFDYARDDGVVQVVSTASNAAAWAGVAIVVGLLGRRVAASDGERLERGVG
jgi:thiosulfate dehydrogenase [quinone] large subunit